MIGARAALAEARAMAEVARRDPSAGNREAVRRALGAVVRHDAEGHGYNPYRDKGGRFAPGEHKAKPKSEAVTKAAAHVEHTAGKRAAAEAKLTEARTAKAAALSDARTKLGEARAAAALARKESSATNVTAAKQATARAAEAAATAKQHIKAAKEATARAGEAAATTKSGAKRAAQLAAAKGASAAAAKASEKAHSSGDAPNHRAAVLAHERAARANRAAGDHTAATDHDLNAGSHLRAAAAADAVGRESRSVDAGLSRLEAARTAAPTPHKDLIDAIGSGGTWDARGNLTALTPAAQAAMRGHFAGLVENTGAAKRGGIKPEDRALVTRSVDEMGASAGLHYHATGRIEINDKTLAHLGQHAGDQAYDAAGAKKAFADDAYHDRGMVAYQVMAHETFHGYGPHLEYSDANKARWQLTEEMSTEMAARTVTAQAHDFPAHKMQGGGYDDVMREAVGHVAELTGASHERAFDAVAQASLSLKRQGGSMTPDDALAHMASHATTALGKPELDFELHARWGALAEDMNRRYPWR